MAQTFLNKRSFLKLAASAAVLSTLAQPALAQSYPDRAITLIVPFAPGGNTDLTARIFATALSEEIGQPVVVDNRPGAGGTTGGGIVAEAEPDGYTLLWSGASLLCMAPLLYPDLSYDVTTAYQPISRIMRHTLVFAVNPMVEADSVDEFIALSKTEPFNYGSPGVGTLHHLTGELLKVETGVQMQHIPYQGNGPAITDLLSGTIQAMFIGLPQALPYQDGELRFLAVTSPERDPAIPDVPSFHELGYPELDVAADSWYGVLAPAGLPADVLATLSEASKAAAMRPDVVEAAAKVSLGTVTEDPQSFADEIEKQRNAWAKLVAETGMTFK